MIDFRQLSPRLQVAIRWLYALYTTGIGLFLLTIAILSVLRIRDIRLETDILVAFGLALIGPIIPFVRRIALPGGGGFDWIRRENKVIPILLRGMPEARANLGEFDLDQTLIGGELSENADDK